MENPINVLVVIDQTIERKGLSHLLNALPSITVIGEAADVYEAERMAYESCPDVILVNQELFQNGGLFHLWRICQGNPGTRILVLSDSSGDQSAASDYELDDLCFVKKNAAPEELTQIIQEVIKREE